MITDTIIENKDFSGLHFTGSTNVFRGIWKKMVKILVNINRIRESLVRQVERILL